MSERAVGAFLLSVVFIVFALVPASNQGFTGEWVAGGAIAYFELVLGVGLLWLAFRHRALASISTPAEIVLGLVVAVSFQLSLTLLEWRWAPELFSYSSVAPPTTFQVLSGAVLYGLMIFGLWMLVFRYPRMAAQAAARASEAERLRMLADQEAMHARFAPHFLLNTLNTIAGLVTEDPRLTRRLISALGDLIRASLYESATVSHTVKDEFSLIGSFTQILEARYEDHVRFQLSLDAQAEGCVFPRLLLQPLVENAVQHGALSGNERSTVSISAAIVDERLRCEVISPGGFQSNKDGQSQGLAIVRRRLELLEPRGTLAFESDRGQTRAILTLSASKV